MSRLRSWVSGPIVTSSRPEQGGLRVPDGHVVLTFDDGPSEWTEQILDLLRARQVRASFFVVGARAARTPGSCAAHVRRRP